MGNTFTLKIYRGMPKNQYWEEFEIALREGLNIISCLMEIQKNPYTKQGKKVEPVVWEQGCLEEVCGSCSVLVNGKPRQACTAIISVILETTKSNIITLAPLSKYPLVRDLIVDRSLMFENLKKVHAWIEADEYGRGPGPKISPAVQEVRYQLSTCMTCGCCTESCPQINPQSKFVGPAITSQVRLFNAHPTGKLNKKERLKPMLEEGGIADCGNAQNCVQVCPKKIPLTDSLAAIGRDASLEALRQFSFPDRE